MSWIHCNKCGVTKTGKDTIEFYCGLCSHILCETCNRHSTCPIDKRPFKGLKINHSLPQRLRTYFEDPNNLLTSWKKCIRFQFEQRIRCEPKLFSENLKQIRQYKSEIKLLRKTKDVLVESITKDRKRMTKIETYLKHCIEHQGQMITSTSSTSRASLNFSSALGESGVDLQFDDTNDSN